MIAVFALFSMLIAPMGTAQAQTAAPSPSESSTATVESPDIADLPAAVAALAQVEGLVAASLSVELVTPQDGVEPVVEQVSPPNDNGPPAELRDDHGGIFTATLSPVANPAEGRSTVQVDWKSVAGTEPMVVSLYSLHTPDASAEPRAFVLSGDLIGFELVEGNLVFAPGTETSGSFLLSQDTEGAVEVVVAAYLDEQSTAIPMVLPAAEAPTAPVEDAPTAPADPTPTIPVAPQPTDPAQPAPVPSADEAPITEAPTSPVAPDPSSPVDQVPAEPTNPIQRIAPTEPIDESDQAPSAEMPLELASNEVIADNVTISANRLKTGTGHGGNDQCGISTRGGVTTPPLDDSAEDDYVCSQDTVSYNIGWSLNPSDTETSVRVRIGTDPNIATISAGTLGAFCTSDPGGTFTAQNHSTDGRTIDCSFIFKAGTSLSGNWPLLYETRVGTPEVWVPPMSVEHNGATVTLNAPGFQVLQTVAYDIRYAGSMPDTPVYKSIDGEIYVRGMYQIAARSISMPTALGISGIKGQSAGRNNASHNISATIAFDDRLPAGTIFENATPTRLTDNGDGTWDFAGSDWMATTSTFQPKATLYAWIPASEVQVPTQWDSYLVNPIAVPVASATHGYYTHPVNFAGIMPEPGTGEPITFSTVNVQGTGSPGGSNGTPNNNWARIDYYLTQAGDIFAKNLRIHNKIGTLSVNGGMRYPSNEAYWLNMDLDADPTRGTASQIVMCDAFTSTTESSDLGMSMYDTSRDPDVRTWVMADDGTVTLVVPEYTLLFKQSGLTGAPSVDQCGDPSDTVGWTTDPTGADTLKIVIDGPVSMLGNGTLSADVYLPMKAGAVTDYPQWPAMTLVRDKATYALNDDPYHLDAKERYFRVGGILAGGTSDFEFLLHDNWWLGTPRPSELGAGTDATGGYRMGFGYDGTPEVGQDMTGTATGRIQLDSCVTDVHDVHLDLWENRPPGHGYELTDEMVWGFEHQVLGDTGECIPGEPGPVIEYSYSFDRSKMTSSGNDGWANNHLVVYFDFTVSPEVRPGSQLSGYASADVDYNHPDINTVVMQESDTFTVLTPQILGQQKFRTHVYEPVGTRVGWETVLFNNTPTAESNVEFLDILPYNGDGRGTDLTNQLQGVLIDATALPGATIYVTTVDPATIPRDTEDPAIDPGDLMWCEYGTTGCSGARSWTAYYVWFDSMAAGYNGTLGVTTDTSNQGDGDWLNNNMAPGSSPSLTYPIPASDIVRTQLWLGTITGTIYEDMGRDGDQQVEIDPGAPTVWVHLLNADLTPVLGGNGEPIRVQVGADGYYEFTDLRPSGYQTMIVTEGTEYAEHDITQAWQVIITDDPAPTRYSGVITIDATTPKVHEVDFGLNTGHLVSIAKFDEAGVALDGAEFSLQDQYGTVIELVIHPDGGVGMIQTSEPLRFGVRYTLTETKAPAGHELLAEPVVFTMASDGITITSGGSDLVTVDSTDTFLLKVGDVTTLAELPNAGGEGIEQTGIFAGLALMGLAAVLLVRNRRKEAGVI